MQYQVFVQSQSKQNFVALIVGMPNLTVEGRTEEETIFIEKLAVIRKESDAVIDE